MSSTISSILANLAKVLRILTLIPLYYARIAATKGFWITTLPVRKPFWIAVSIGSAAVAFDVSLDSHQTFVCDLIELIEV